MGNPIPARIIGVPVVEEIGVGLSKTFFSIGAFDNKIEADNLKKYLCTKFARCMVGTLKITNGLKDTVWANVPLQDFTDKSDVNWSKSIHDIDLYLYDKYCFTQEEIEFIEKNVKEMN